MTQLKSLVLSIVVSALGFLSVSGQETLVLKNGSRLYGQRTIEDYNDNTVTFRIDSADMVIPYNDLHDISPRLTLLSETPESWRRWFNQHPERIVLRNNAKYVWLGAVNNSNNDRKFYKDYVVIHEVEDTVVRVFTTSIGEIKVSKNKEIDHIEIAPREPLALVGTINEIETTNQGTLRGQIVEDRAKSLVLLTDDGVRHVIPYKVIKASRIIPFNPNRPLNEQISHHQRLEGNKDSGFSAVGIVTETVYKSHGNEEGYYILADTEGLNKTKYPFSQVLRIKKIPNTAFVKEKDVKIDGDQLLIQFREAVPVKYEVKSDRYEIADTTKAVRINKADIENGMLKIHFKDTPVNTDFIFVEAKPVQVDKSAKKSGKDNNDADVVFYASLNDMLINSYSPVNRFVSPSGNVSLTYGNVEAGKAYLLIRKSDPLKSAYFLVIE